MVRVTFPEGWTAHQMAALLESRGITSAKDYLVLVDKEKREGFLFPDTYRIYKNSSAEDIIKKMLDNFDAKLAPDLRLAINSQGKTIFDVITMASIIQNEVKNLDDMKVVSGIFWNRIKIGQALGSDATLTYVLGVKKDRHSLEETNLDSPYNTYKYKGLPPGPISNPGINSIVAAIYPTDTDYNYFLTDSNSGQTIFSKTFDEHIKNKAKYLK